jgi:formate transporter
MTLQGKILAIVFPITAFVAAGFEHSVANMYFIPAGILVKDVATADFWLQIQQNPADLSFLNWKNYFLGNLLPVSLGNIIGGSLFIGAAYWFIYLSKWSKPSH